MSSSSSSVRPEFKVISVADGQEFMRQVVEFSIDRYPDLVEMLNRGVVPMEMLELPMNSLRGSNIGRKAGAYIGGKVRLVEDQSASQYREIIIAETIAADVALAAANQATAHTGALAILFPESGKVTREKFRAKVDRESRALLQMLTMSWPSIDIRTRMESDGDLDEAFKKLDLIAWVKAFNKFCLNSSGNKQLSRENAEKTLESIKMKGIDLSTYVRDFVKAADNLATVGSSWNDLRIVTLFIKNLNQSESVFNNAHRKFSDKHESIYVLQANKLSFAVTWIEDYFKEVIAPYIAEKKQDIVTLATAKDVHQKVNQYTKRGGSSNSSSSDIAKVPVVVLATLVSDKRKSEEQLASVNKKFKELSNTNSKLRAEAKGNQKADNAKPKGVSFNEDKSSETKPPINKAKDSSKSTAKCWKFASPEGCTRGTACRFLHSA